MSERRTSSRSRMRVAQRRETMAQYLPTQEDADATQLSIISQAPMQFDMEVIKPEGLAVIKTYEVALSEADDIF